MNWIDPWGLSASDGQDRNGNTDLILSGLTKIFSGTCKTAAGLGGVAVGSFASGVLVADNATGVLTVDDAALFVTVPFTAASGKYAFNGSREAVDGLTELTVGVVGTARTLGTWIGDKAKSAWDNLSNLKAKERREQEQNKSKEEKHGTSDWEDPESEDYVEWQKKQAIKKGGKDAGRRGHDAKPKGAPDRSKREIDDDYDQ